MAIRTEDILLHKNRVLWNDHKPVAEVELTREQTIPHIWETTYQGNPTSPKGKIYKKEWFDNRFTDVVRPVARIISLDTALSDSDLAAQSAVVVADLQTDYSLRIIHAEGRHIQFPQLVEWTTNLALQYNQDKFLKWIVIEKKVSGFSLIQTLKQSTERWIAGRVFPYTPKSSKDQRYQQSTVWCNNGMVKLPAPSESYPWLFDFEDDLFSCPDIPYKDKMDAFAQLILYLANYLAQGHSQRLGL